MGTRVYRRYYLIYICYLFTIRMYIITTFLFIWETFISTFNIRSQLKKKKTLKFERKTSSNKEIVEGTISVTPDSILHKTKPKLHPHIGFSFSIVSCLNSSGGGFDAKPRVHSSSAFFEHKQRFKCGVETTKEHKLQFSFKICPIEVQTLFCVNCNVNGRNELFHLFEHFG